MAPKRFKKSDTNEENGEKYKNLILSDVLCPICRSILIEPVTLPCNHGFCLACFNGTMENTALTCPLCRIRIGSWLRSTRKENKIVNDVLWRMIQIKFSKEIRKKIDGEDITSEEKITIKLANPGEIRREYELQLEKERSEIQKQRDSEAKASEVVIQKILEEEKSIVKLEKEKLLMDEELAKRLSVEQKAGPSSQNPSTPKSSKKSSIDRYLIALSKKKQEPEMKSKNERDTNKSKTSENSSPKMIATIDLTTPTKPLWRGTTTVMCQKKEAKQQCSKAFQHLLLSKTLHYDRAESIGSDSSDSIKQEMRYFKPIRLAPAADFRNDLSSPLVKIIPKVAKSPTSVVIRSPHKNVLVRIGSHPGSAFVSCSPEKYNSPQKVENPSIAGESGKVVKQYYNRKRNTLQNRLESCKVTSPVNAPCLGFEIKCEQKHVTIMRDLVSTMSENINRCLARNFDSKNILKELRRQNFPCIETHSNSKSRNNLKISPKKVIQLSPKKRSPRKINGCDVLAVVDAASTEANLQEKLDLEFAKKLHEELNNPRSRPTRASIQPKKPAVKTRSSPRKRQVTLDELISPKKFKI